MKRPNARDTLKLAMKWGSDNDIGLGSTVTGPPINLCNKSLLKHMLDLDAHKNKLFVDNKGMARIGIIKSEKNICNKIENHKRQIEKLERLLK